MKEKILNTLKHKKALLIIDALEDALLIDGEAVRNFFFKLLEKLSDLKILLISRDRIINLCEITENVYELKHLTKYHTIEMLKKKWGRE